MFFTDPPRALDEIRSSLKPSGRAVFAVWGERERNPFFDEVANAVRVFVPHMPVPEPDEPHPFRYGPAGKLAALLRAGGWTDVEDEPLHFDVSGPISQPEFWDFMLSMSADLEKIVGELPEHERAALRSGLDARIEPYFPEGYCRFPAEAHLVSARRPAAR
jgi:hypothetical protein